MMKTYTLDLSMEDVNKVLDALSQQPYRVVHELIPKIITQCKAQEEEPA